ncbi:MAG TPA: glycoside hydrolase family 44 protein [Candidatus Kapabacteria bacterium]|nr:glycoside hydrolase family 44 protein [Candidatus Kapabacteria bacterium]
MKRILFLLLLAATPAYAQISVNFTVDAAADRAPISPYIYGINWGHGGEALHADWNLASRRLGGDRISTYNWEVNASNSGNDCDASCKDENDDWLTFGLPGDVQEVPGILPKTFHQASKDMGAYSLVQLQGAGYVAADRNDNVRPVPAAPNGRWKEVKFRKGAPLSLTPDPNDASVYMDEQLNYLINLFGTSDHGGIQGYAIENEPGLWYSTHPRMRGLSYVSAEEVATAEQADPNNVKNAKVTCTELIQKNTDLAKLVKEMDPKAEVFGPVFWGFLDYYSLTNAPDWTNYSNTYATFVDMYLDRMHQAEVDNGHRLVDVLDVHWYPQVAETPEKIMQCTRSLWDPTYKEDSWIANDVLGGPINLFGTLKASIDRYYPGTKLAITEFRYGDASNGDTYYSGIGVADALGIFGRYGVYMAHYLQTDFDQPIEGYVAAAYKIYRNYDGAMSTFGSTAAHAATSDVPNSSIYASLDEKTKGRLHLIVINRNMTQAVNGHFALSGGEYRSARVYAFDNNSSAITERAGVAAIANNQFGYTIPPLTVAHFVIEANASAVPGVDDAGTDAPALVQSGPNPFNGSTAVRIHLAAPAHATVTLTDALGRTVATPADGEFEAGDHTVTLDAAANGLPSGVYFCRLQSGTTVRSIAVRMAK